MSTLVDLVEQVTTPLSRNPFDYEIIWVLDYGTKKLAFGCQIVLIGNKPGIYNTVILQLHGDRPRAEIPQILGFVRQSSQSQFSLQDFQWGFDLDAKLSDEPSLLKEGRVCIVERLKIALIPTEHTNQAREEVEAALSKTGIKGLTPEYLFQLHLEHVKKAALKATVDCYSHQWTQQEIEDMDIRTFFTVPEVTSEATVNMLQKAFKDAGYGPSYSLSEGESAGCWCSSELLYNRQELGTVQVDDDEEILVADGGGLTLDVSSYLCRGFVRNGVDIHITPTGRRQGSACGAEIINKKCFDWVRRCCADVHGSFNECVARLGYSAETFQWQILKQFEGFKASFLDHGELTLWVHPNMTQEANVNGVRAMQVTITRNLMKKWFDEAFEDVKKVIDSVRRPSTKTILLCGGFFRSEYLIKKLKVHYSPYLIRIPNVGTHFHGMSDPSVIFGGMARSVLRDQPVHPNFSMGVAQDESYKGDEHKYIFEGKPTYIPRRHSLVKQCDFTGDRYVEDRWCTLLNAGDLANMNGIRKAEPVYQVYYLSIEEPFLSKQVHVSHGPIKDSDPMVAHFKDGTSSLRAEIEEWGDEIKIYIPEEMLKTYTEMPSPPGKAGQEWYEVWARLKIKRSGPGMMDVELKWDIAEPGYKPYRNGRSDDHFQAPRKRQLKVIGRSTLHDSKHPSFIRRNAVASSQAALRSLEDDEQPEDMVSESSASTDYGSDIDFDFDPSNKSSQSRSKLRRRIQSSGFRAVNGKRPRLTLSN